MASTYVNNLRIEEQATGENSGAWGTKLNAALEQIGQALGIGSETIGNADATITVADGANDDARALYIKIASSTNLTATRTITMGPNTMKRIYIIENATGGAQSIIIKQGSGATVTVANSAVKIIQLDGAGSGAAVIDALVDLDLTGTTTAAALNVSGAFTNGSTLVSTGKITADAGIDIDNFNIDGTTIALSSGDMILDGAGDIILDGDDGDIILKDGGTTFGQFSISSGDFFIQNPTADKDIVFRGLDGSSYISALTLDMSDAGTAIFNNKVGIGTTSPAATLHILTSTNAPMIVESTHGDGGYIELQLSDSGGAGSLTGYIGDSQALIASGTAADLAIRAQANLVFSTGGSAERFRIDSSGNVGIGTSSPVPSASAYNSASLHLHQASGGSTGSQIHLTNAATGGAAGDGSFIAQWQDQSLYITNQENANIVFSANGSEKMRIDSSGNLLLKNSGNDVYLDIFADSGSNRGNGYLRFLTDGASAQQDIAQILFSQDTGDGAARKGAMAFQVSDNGAPATALSISNNKLVTTASHLLATGGVYISAFDGDKLITDGSQGGGSDALYIGNAQIQVSSDERIKKDVVNTAINATEELKKVRVVDFTWNDPTDTSYNNKNARGKWTGAVAQELISVFPHIINAPRDKETLEVDNDSERKWLVEYQNLVPVLIKSIQELSAKNDALEARLKTLEDA